MWMKKKLGIWCMVLALCILTTGIAQYDIKTLETVPTAVYSQGSRGDIVRQIQQRLSDWGYYSGSIDGIFGSGTVSAVKEFQSNNGLVADGIVGSATLEALGISDTATPPTADTISESELRLLAAAIHGEARGEPYEGQVAIGGVILNRVASPDFPNTISGVIYQRGAFDAVKDGQINLEPNDSAFRAAQDALNGWDPSEGALYYWNPATATSRWIWSVPITKSIGRHVFGTK